MPQSRKGVVCPFLGHSTDTGNYYCLSEHEDPQALGLTYVKGFCLKARHFTCARFVRAPAAVRREAQERRGVSGGAGEAPAPSRDPFTADTLPKPSEPNAAGATSTRVPVQHQRRAPAPPPRTRPTSGFGRRPLPRQPQTPVEAIPESSRAAQSTVDAGPSPAPGSETPVVLETAVETRRPPEIPSGKAMPLNVSTIHRPSAAPRARTTAVSPEAADTETPQETVSASAQPHEMPVHSAEIAEVEAVEGAGAEEDVGTVRLVQRRAPSSAKLPSAVVTRVPNPPVPLLRSAVRPVPVDDEPDDQEPAAPPEALVAAPADLRADATGGPAETIDGPAASGAPASAVPRPWEEALPPAVEAGEPAEEQVDRTVPQPTPAVREWAVQGAGERGSLALERPLRDAVPAPTPKLREQPRSRTVRRLAWVLLAVAIVFAGLVTILGMVLNHHGASHPVHTGTHPPQPALLWHFAAITQPADQTTVIVNNTNATSVTVVLHVNGRSGPASETTTVPAHAQAELDLAFGRQNDALSISSSAPILPQRVVLTGGQAHTSYGVRGGG